MLQPDPRSPHQQLTLFQLENQVDQYMQYTMVEQANVLARTLAKRELPMFYFSEAGEELGITAKTCRVWKIDAWPMANRPNDENLIHKVAIYIRVYLRLKDCPNNETYLEANIRLQRRIRELGENGYSRNQIAQQMRMSFRTLKDLCERLENLRERLENPTEKLENQPNGPEALRENEAGPSKEAGEEPLGPGSHCPWGLLDRLKGAEEEIARQRELQVKFQDLRVIHPGADYRDQEINPDPPSSQNVIKVKDPCRKCNAGWQSLREDGVDGWNRPIMVCMICGTENAIDLGLEDPDSVDLQAPEEQEFIERYAPCRHCQAYWNHMKLERTDRWSNSVYICLRCTTVNRVKPRRQKSRTL